MTKTSSLPSSHFARRRPPGAMVAAECDGDDVRWQHPGALRAAVLTANGVGGRDRWTTKQGIDYSSFRLALVGAKDGRVRRKEAAPAVADTTSASASSTMPVNRAQGTPAPSNATSRQNVFTHATVDAQHRICDAPQQTNEASTTGARRAGVTVAKWSHRSGHHERNTADSTFSVALGRADGVVEILIASLVDTGILNETETDSSNKFRLSTVATLVGHVTRITSIGWSPNDDRLVTGSSDGEVRLWSAVATGDTGDTAGDTGRVGDTNGDTTNKWTCARVIRCGEASESCDGSKPPTGTSTKNAVPVVGVNFHPMNPNVVFVARAARSLSILNASTGLTSANVESPAWMPSRLNTMCLDCVGRNVFCGDTEGRVLVVEYKRADLNQSKRRLGWGTNQKSVSNGNTAVKETGAGNEAPRATADAAVSSVVDTNCPYAIPSDNTPEVPQTRKARLLDQLRFHSKRAVETHKVGVKQLGCDHALVFSTKSNPPPDVQHDGVGVVSLVYAGYASVTRGPALFVSFGSGAVMVYKAGSSEVSFVTTVSHGNGSSLTGTKTKPNPSVSKFALQPALRVPFPLWPGAKKGFIQIAPITDPTAPVLCVASTRNGPPAVYQVRVVFPKSVNTLFADFPE
jgi:WD40 repeat protein